MNRKDFQKPSKIRIKEARKLLDGGLFSGSYYLAGYSLEFALKASIARLLGTPKPFEFPKKEFRQFIDDIYTHNLRKLFDSADLWNQFDKELKNNKQLSVNWSLVQGWSENARYEFKTEVEAKDLFKAITDKSNGVLPWLKKYW